MDNETTSAIELGWNILYAIAGAIVAAIGLAIKFGAKISSFVTREELDKRLETHARVDHLTRVEKALSDLDAKQETRHNQIIELILEGRGDK